MTIQDFSSADVVEKQSKTENGNGNQMVMKGIPSSPGIIIGKAFVIKQESLIVPDEKIPLDQINDELNRFDNAQSDLVQQFLLSLNRVKSETGNIAAIMETNLLILSDPVITDSIKNTIKKGFSAESAVVQEFEKQRNYFKNTKDEILRERAVELDHIKQMLISVLKNQCINYSVAKNSIVVAQSLTTTDIVNFKEAGVIAFITEIGSIASHASILARSFDIPAVIGVKNACEAIHDSNDLIVDGFAGIVINRPRKVFIERYTKKISEIEEHKRRLGALVKMPAETIDGKKIQILTNVNFLDDVRTGVLNGADGVGLVRSENLIMELKKIPEEDTQYNWYKEISDRAYPTPVSIRVFDIGSDKYSEGLPFNEENPALGFRGIRFLLSRKDIFETQLRAILRASVNKNIKILLPMISSLHEVEYTIELLDICKKKLDEEGIPYDTNIPIGVMIETPAAALIADGLSEAVNFFSIGTNDLTQYTLAADRTNELVSDIFDSFHPAVLRLIKLTIEAANQKNIPVGVCGELAGHAASTDLLLGLGISELSVAPSIILELKNRIRNSSYQKTKQLADDILHCSSYKGVRERLDLALKDLTIIEEKDN